MRMYSKITAVSIVIAILSAFVFLAPKTAFACYGASCEGQNPSTTGCNTSVDWLNYVNVYRCGDFDLCSEDYTGTGLPVATIEYSYSPTCHATWAKLYGFTLPAAGATGTGWLEISRGLPATSYSVSGPISSSRDKITSMMVEGQGAQVCVHLKYFLSRPRISVDDSVGCFYPSSETKTIKPNFHVLALAYAAPGKQSVVTYGGSSSFGTETSSSSTFKTDVSVTVGPKFFSVTAGVSGTVSSSTSLQVTKSTMRSWPVESTVDPIDHGNDTFFVWINPEVDLMYTVGFPNVEWTLHPDSSGFTRVVPLTVYNAIDPTTIPDGHKPYFAKLTREDYDAILSLNPYVDVATRTIRRTIPLTGSDRFEPTGISMPLDGRVGSSLKTVDSSSVKKKESTQISIDVGYSGGVKLGGLLRLFKTSTKYSWTFASSKDTTWSKTQSAEISLKTASTTFAGLYDVYFDRIFGTFLLVDAPVTPLRSTGIVLDASGKPVIDERVTMQLPDGSKRITYTDGEGRYRFYQIPEGISSIEVRGERWTGRIDRSHPAMVNFKTAPRS